MTDEAEQRGSERRGLERRGASEAAQPSEAQPLELRRYDARSLALGLAAGALSGLPAALRAVGRDAPVDLLVALGALAVPMAVVAPVVLALRRTRLPQAPSPGHPARPRILAELGAASLLALLPLTLLGSWISGSTHHRPLGAVTFALLAAVVLALAFVVARRLLASGRRPLIAACLAVPGAASAYLVLRGVVLGIGAGPVWLDGLAVLAWTAAATWLPSLRGPNPASGSGSSRPAQRARSAGLGRAALGIWLTACTLAAAVLLFHVAELAAVAPAFAWPAR